VTGDSMVMIMMMIIISSKNDLYSMHVKKERRRKGPVKN
jgi:hypothetical protein